MTNETRKGLLEACGDGETPQDRRSRLRFSGFSLAWAICFVGATFLLKRELLPAGAASWVVAALPTVAAVFLLLAFGRFLRDTDELERLIQLKALALGFGGSFFIFAGYRMFELIGAPAAPNDLLVVMPILYVVGILLGRRRYR